MTDLLNNRNTTVNDPTKPKAYLNYILLDEQLKPVITSDGKNSGFKQVGADQEFSSLIETSREITKNGYLYIYVSNESLVDVFFDNLQVTHIRGPLLEETHYYPFGLTMAGISSKAAGKLENKMKFNGGSEQGNDLNIGIYETIFRGLDEQTGRWWQVDPMAEINLSNSLYSFVNNNPISYFDPFGLDSVKVGVNNGQTNAKATNTDGSTGTYTINGNNIEGTGMSGSSEVIVTNSKKSNSVLSVVSLAGGYLSLLNDSYDNSGQLQRPLNLLQNGKFEAFYKGELQTWKLGFKGNGSVPSRLVNIQKDNFLKVVANNAKMLEFIKRGGVMLNAAGVGLTLIDMKVNGVNANNSTDLVVGMIAFVPGGGWIVSSLYFIGKETGFNKGMVEFVGEVKKLNDENKDNLMWHVHE